MQLLKYYQGVLNKPTTYKLEETNKRQIKKEGAVKAYVLKFLCDCPSRELSNWPSMNRVLP